MPSLIFLLPLARQSETIPRSLRPAARGPTNPDGPRAGRQGQARVLRSGQESRSLKTEVNRIAFHRFYTSVEIAREFLFLTTATQVGRERETVNAWDKFLE